MRAREPRMRAPWAAVLLALVVLAGCGSSTTPGGSGTTTIPGTQDTAVSRCPSFGSTGSVSGRPAATSSGTVLMRNVQVQASGCVDEVSFLFWKGTPVWTAGYRDGPLTLDPSGQPAAVAGAAHLVIRFQQTSGVDLSTDPPRQAYEGPTQMSPGPPSGVAAVSRLGDFEAVTTWAVGLPGRRAFEVATRADQLVIRLAAPTRRRTRCDPPGSSVSVGYPAGWYAELSPRWYCRYFDPGPFVVYPATDAADWAVTAQAADSSADEVVSRAGSGATVRTHHARVAGLDATVLDATTTGQGLYPSGHGFRMYVLPTSPTAFVISSRPAPPGPRTAQSRAAADRIAALVETR